MKVFEGREEVWREKSLWLQHEENTGLKLRTSLMDAEVVKVRDDSGLNQGSGSENGTFTTYLRGYIYQDLTLIEKRD